MSGVQIRVAKDQKPSREHRDFTENEKWLNQFKTEESLFLELEPHIDPYRAKANREPKNPFQFMSVYKLKEHVKVIESGEKWITEVVEPVKTATQWLWMLRELLKCETSEAMACYLIFKDKLEAHTRKSKSELSDSELESVCYESIQQFRSDWEKAMNGLMPLWK